MYSVLNEDNFIMFAIRCYDSPTCNKHEFEEDFKRLKYVKRLLKRYRVVGELKERLILNHIIVLSNVFGAHNISRMLFYKVEENDWPVLKTFLLYLNLMPDIIMGIGDRDVVSDDITVDVFVGKRLRDI